jgi:hypothetical protein
MSAAVSPSPHQQQAIVIRLQPDRMVRQLTHFLPDSIRVLPYRYICINFFRDRTGQLFFFEAD